MLIAVSMNSVVWQWSCSVSSVSKRYSVGVELFDKVRVFQTIAKLDAFTKDVSSSCSGSENSDEFWSSRHK